MLPFRIRRSGVSELEQLAGVKRPLVYLSNALGCDSGANFLVLRRQGSYRGVSSGAGMSDSSSGLLRRKMKSSKSYDSDEESASLKPR